ncbi:MAG: four helix bundle protein [Bacteroidetes bacterium HGW-Bacteroidetes-12]|nr:MAG: four helix bundle protein [Bacteroidetes bacterium HGW-Bacteroidetes-12]
MKLEDLKLYQECLNLEATIWKIANNWEGFNKDTVGKSFVNAADAISSNIAGGYGRYNFKDKKHYCYISRGFLLETKGWVIKSKERGLLDETTHNELIENVEKIHRMLNAYIRSIGRKKEDSTYSDATNSNNYDEDDNHGNSFTASADEFFSEEELSNA